MEGLRTRMLMKRTGPSTETRSVQGHAPTRPNCAGPFAGARLRLEQRYSRSSLTVAVGRWVMDAITLRLPADSGSGQRANAVRRENGGGQAAMMLFLALTGEITCSFGKHRKSEWVGVYRWGWWLLLASVK